MKAVSYTHLDVYKRQGQNTFIVYDEIQKKEIGKFHATSFRKFYT